VLGEASVLLILLVGPSLHHVAKLYGGPGAVASEVTVDVLHGEAVLEAVDDVLVGDVGDGGAYLEEAPSVGP
jgi:xanthine dehydrogenase molybdopterin-binding subunit B